MPQSQTIIWVLVTGTVNLNAKMPRLSGRMGPRHQAPRWLTVSCSTLLRLEIVVAIARITIEATEQTIEIEHQPSSSFS